MNYIIKPDCIIEEIDEELVVFYEGTHILNETAAYIWKSIEENVSFNDMINTYLQKKMIQIDMSEVIKDDFRKCILMMIERGLIIEGCEK